MSLAFHRYLDRARDVSIVKRMRLLIGVIAGAAVGIVLVAVWQSSQSRDAMSGVTSQSQSLARSVLPLVKVSGDLKTDIAQVEHFLTDISAIRGEDRLDAKFNDAATFATDFRANLGRARMLARDLDDPRLLAQIDTLGRDFEPFYASGRRMARAYIAKETESGNASTRKFDDESLALQQSVTALLKLSDQIAARHVNALVIDEAALSGAINRGVGFISIFCALLLAICFAAAWHIRAQLVEPLLALSSAISKAGGSAARLDLRDEQSDDEIGIISRALGEFRATAVRHEREQASRQEATEQSMRDRAEQATDRLAFQEQFAAERKARASELAQAFEQSVGGVSGAISAAAKQLDQLASAMTATMINANAETARVATSSQQAFSGVEAVAEASDELAHSISEIASQVSRQDSLSEAADASVRAGVGAAEALQERARSIDQIVASVSQLSGQTSMLALNATIEAARAGAAGHGFAVVANEVKSLAEQTGKSAEAISTQVDSVKGDVSTTAEAIRAVSHSLDSVREISRSVTFAVNQQRAATEEISRSASEAVRGTQEVARSIETVRGAIEAAKDTAHQLNQAAEELERQSDALKTSAGTFLKRLSA